MLIFFRPSFFGFRTLVVATTVCKTGVYIHSLVARTFSSAQRAHSVLRTLLMRVSHTHGSRVCKKGVCTCVVSLHLAFSLLLSHPSFAVSVRRLSLDFPSTSSCRTYLSQKRRACASPHEDEKFGFLAKSALNTGYEPKKFDKITSVDNDTMLIDDPHLSEISDFSKNTHDNTGLFGVLTKFESFVSHVSHYDFALEKEKRRHASGNRLPERERVRTNTRMACCLDGSMTKTA